MDGNEEARCDDANGLLPRSSAASTSLGEDSKHEGSLPEHLEDQSLLPLSLFCCRNPSPLSLSLTLSFLWLRSFAVTRQKSDLGAITSPCKSGEGENPTLSSLPNLSPSATFCTFLLLLSRFFFDPKNAFSLDQMRESFSFPFLCLPMYCGTCCFACCGSCFCGRKCGCGCVR